MITLTAGEIALLVGGELHCDKDLLVSKAPVFDSRLATPGCIFLALKGEHADGHDFVADAYRAGAMFSLTTHRIVIQDQIPITQNTDITIESANLAKGRLNERTGVIEWSFNLKPKENKVIDFDYKIRHSKDKEINI